MTIASSANKVLGSISKSVRSAASSLSSGFGGYGLELTPYGTGIVVCLGLLVLNAVMNQPTGKFMKLFFGASSDAGNTKLYSITGSSAIVYNTALFGSLLLPAFAAVRLENPYWNSFALTGLAAMLAGIGLNATIPAAFVNNGDVESRWQKAGSALASGLNNVAVGFWIGAVIAFSKDYRG